MLLRSKRVRRIFLRSLPIISTNCLISGSIMTSTGNWRVENFSVEGKTAAKIWKKYGDFRSTVCASVLLRYPIHKHWSDWLLFWLISRLSIKISEKIGWRPLWTTTLSSISNRWQWRFLWLFRRKTRYPDRGCYCDQLWSSMHTNCLTLKVWRGSWPLIPKTPFCNPVPQLLIFSLNW